MTGTSGVSVLMAVYAGDRGEWVAEALRSLRTQTRPPEQVVVVQDGPVGDDVAAVLAAADLTLVELAANGGLAAALQAGLPHCAHDLVARMDADDVAEPDRLALQVAAMDARPELSALGGQVGEFSTDPAVLDTVRAVAVGTGEVARAARWRNPLNHQTVMFRRAHVLAAGGYDSYAGFEDYVLWARLLVAGRQLDNLPVVLVRQRAGAALGARRGGSGYARTEVAVFRELHRIGLVSAPQALAGLAVRLPVRLAPGPLRWWFYRRALRRRGYPDAR